VGMLMYLIRQTGRDAERRQRAAERLQGGHPCFSARETRILDDLVKRETQRHGRNGVVHIIIDGRHDVIRVSDLKRYCMKEIVSGQDYTDAKGKVLIRGKKYTRQGASAALF
jgi:hypothetical protein